LPLLVMILSGAFADTPSFLSALESLEVLPFVWPVAVIWMGPGGAVLGALGAAWICRRSRTLSSGRLLLEAQLLGTLLGAVVRLTTRVFGPVDGNCLRQFIPMGAVTGLICAFIVFHTLNRFGLLLPVRPDRDPA
jgi:hypothetical protein